MYITTSNRSKAARKLCWYYADDIVDYVHQLKDFILLSNRKLSPVYLPILPQYDPSMLFNPKIRFPENTYLICDGIGDWNFRLQRIQLLTSIITNNHRINRLYDGIPTVGDAELALLGGIDEVLRVFEKGDFLVDRIEFENRYKLVWEPSEDDYQVIEQEEEECHEHF